MPDELHTIHERIFEEIRAVRDDTVAWRTATEARIASVEKRLTGVENTLEVNTRMTEQVRDAVVAARVAHAVMKWVSGVVVAGVGLWIALKQFVVGAMGRGPLP